MLKKEIEQRQAIEMLCTDMLVPQDHLLRKIDKAVDFTHIYEFVEGCYSEENGRPSIGPVVLFKLVMIQHLFGIRSLRQTQAEAEVNVAYRWFLGYTMSQPIPHFSTISYAFRHRFTEEIVEKVFRWILEEIAKAGYLRPEVVFIDGTHIKANANMKKHVKKEIPKAARVYEEQLMEEINADREQLDRLVQLSGLTKQDYITDRLLERAIVVNGNPKVYKALKRQLTNVLDELRRIEAGASVDEELMELIRFIASIMNGMKEESK